MPATKVRQLNNDLTCELLGLLCGYFVCCIRWSKDGGFLFVRSLCFNIHNAPLQLPALISLLLCLLHTSDYDIVANSCCCTISYQLYIPLNILCIHFVFTPDAYVLVSLDVQQPRRLQGKTRRGPKKGPQKYVIDVSHPVDDGIMDPANFVSISRITISRVFGRTTLCCSP
jgi:hypothetical protein